MRSFRIKYFKSSIQKMYIYIAIVTILLYSLLQFMDDKRNESLKRTKSAIGTKIAIFVFTFIITTTVFYLFWDSSALEEGRNTNNDLKHINQDINTGFPDF